MVITEKEITVLVRTLCLNVFNQPKKKQRGAVLVRTITGVNDSHEKIT